MSSVTRNARPGPGSRHAAQHALPHEHRVVARRGARPDELRPVGRAREAAQRRQRAAHDVARGVVEDRVGQPLVERGALGVERAEGRAVARERPPPPARAPPGRGDVDVEQHDDVAGERGLHPGRGHGAAAEREHRPGRLLEQPADQLLLRGAEGGLAVVGEEVLDRHPEPLLEEVVGVRRARAHPAGRRPRGRRLARPHEPDEDERRPGRGRYAAVASTRSALRTRRPPPARRRCGRRRTSRGRRRRARRRASPHPPRRPRGPRRSRCARAAPARARASRCRRSAAAWSASAAASSRSARSAAPPSSSRPRCRRSGSSPGSSRDRRRRRSRRGPRSPGGPRGRTRRRGRRP